MANIKKSFNFRNGVQVDSDNLLVTSTGLVGIGTTVPSESLDVIGNVSISGLTSTSEATIGVLTVTSVKTTEIIGAGVSIKSGIITSSGAGVVTFFGDGSNLSNIPTSQFTAVGGGSTNVFIIPSVGIATTNPSFNLQIGNNVDSGGKGVGINSLGDVKASGIITATTFSGNLTGNVTGNTQGIHTGAVNLGDDVKLVLGNSDGLEIYHSQTLEGTNDSYIDSSARNLFVRLNTGAANGGNIALQAKKDSTGILIEDGDAVKLYFNAPVNQSTEGLKLATTGYGVTIFGTAEIQQLNVTGVSTFSGNIDANGNLDVDGLTNLDNVTIDGNVDLNGDLDVDGHTNLDNVNITGVTTTTGIIEGVSGENKIPALYSNMGALPNPGTYHGMFAHVHATGRGYFSHAGGWYELVNKETNGRVGTGTEVYNIADIINRNIISSGIITATTELNSPLIGVGTDVPANDIQVRKNGNTEIQVTSDTGSAGITVGREPSTGNTNNAELRYGLVSGGVPFSSAQSLDLLNYGTGNFNYHLSANNASAVAGDFHWHKGINNTLMTLTGIGGSLGIGVTQPTTTLDVSGSGNFSGNLTVGGNFVLSGTLNSNVTGNVTGNLTGNVTGDLTGNVNSISGISSFNNLKYETNLTSNTGAIGLGTNSPRSGVDFVGAGQTFSRYMLPPQVSNTERVGLVTVTGALVYNTTINKLQVYNGNAWETITSAV